MSNDNNFMSSKDLAGIQYWGEDGITQECLDAVMRLLQYDDHVTRVRILNDGERFCLLVNLGEVDLVAIKSGFSYGYAGEGPRKFSRALALFEAHDIKMDEFDVDSGIIKRVNESGLTKGDLEKIDSLKPVRPLRIYDYIETNDFNGIKEGTLWKIFRPVIPFAIIDPRIMDLAVSFWKHPDANLNNGYRRFEDVVRARTGLKEKTPKQLFTKAFLAEDSVLGWGDIDNGEKVARASIMIDVFSAYRNPRAHKEKQDHSHECLSEFLLLNHLFRLESESSER